MLDMRLGHFHLNALLGTGGMGVVWQARYEGPGAEFLPEGLRRDVAVKVMTAPKAQAPDWRSAFATEIRAVARLHHRFIPAIFDFGEVSQVLADQSEGKLVAGSPWFAVDLCDGGSLAARLDSMDWGDIRSVLLALLDALGHAHSRGLIHRDLKPANILFDGPDDILKLVDFGLAVDTSGGAEDQEEDFVVGTPSSMAPEQFEGRTRDFGPWTDLYALGCLAHRLVCRRRPYAPRDQMAIREAHLTWPLPRLEAAIAVPDGLEPWVHRLLAKEPADRFQLAADARNALINLEESQPQAATSVALGDWRGADAPSLRGLHTTGLPLFGLRPIPFVGREDHRDALWDLLGSVTQSRQPHLVALVGPAGVGKSRLASWLTETAHERGIARPMLAIHGAEPNDAHGIEAMLRRGFGTLGLTRRAVFDRLEHRWGGQFEDLALHALARLLHHSPWEMGGGLMSEAERHALTRLALIQEAHARPLIVVLDDVHHSADAIRFAQTFMATVEDLPVLVVVTARTEDLAVSEPVRQALDDALEAPRALRLPVEALPTEDSARFVGEMLGFRADLRGRVTQRIQGNPLFAVQLVADWVARGLLVSDEEGYHMVESEPIPIPPDLRAVWDSRLKTFLDGRPQPHEVALEAAAALGGPIDTHERVAVCEQLGAAPGDLLRDLLDQGLAIAHEDGWDLVHGMLREALHERAKTADRWAALQMACAHVLETGSHDRTRLGHHLLASGTTERAIPELMDGLEADMRSGNLARAEETAHQVQQTLSDPATPLSTLATAALQRARLARLRGRIHAATRELLWCDDAIDSATHPSLAALAATEDALIAYRAGDLQRVIDRSSAGEHLAREVDAEDLVGRCLEVRARALTDRAEWSTARRTYEEARSTYEAIDDAMRVATCDLGLGWVACSEGALDLADQHIRSGLTTFERLGNREQMGTAHNMLGEAARARGAVEDAVQHYRRALEFHDNCGATASATIAELNLSIMLVGSDRTREARAGVHRRLRTMIGLGHGQFVDAAKLVLLVCDAQDGQWQGWLEKFEAVSRGLAESGQVHEDLATLAELAVARATAENLPGEAKAAEKLATEQRTRLSAQ